MVREMIGGCCVCLDERGWNENPLVYCDGAGCTVAVHQACYGIVKVPSGPWFCCKCRSTERIARLKCELCPIKEGALKRTDTGGWAHVVCALYIPEVRFGNVSTMEPIIFSSVPHDRFMKPCYICDENGRESNRSSGACMACHKVGCKLSFHVTCAQSKRLLCEEASINGHVQYVGYCRTHWAKRFKQPTNSTEQVNEQDIKKSLKDKKSRSRTESMSSVTSIEMGTTKVKKKSSRPPDLNTQQKNISDCQEDTISPAVGEASDHSMYSSSKKAAIPSAQAKYKDNSSFTVNGLLSDSKAKTSSPLNTPVIKEEIKINEKVASSDEEVTNIEKATDTLSKKRKLKEKEKGKEERKKAKLKVVKETKTKESKLKESIVNSNVKKDNLDKRKKEKLDLKQKLKSSDKKKKIPQPSKLGLVENGKVSSWESITPKNIETPDNFQDFLEHQWNQSAQFILSKAQHFDAASLLTTLHQLKGDNTKLENKLTHLQSRRDRLLGVNARLAASFAESAKTIDQEHNNYRLSAMLSKLNDNNESRPVNNRYKSPESKLIASDNSTISSPDLAMLAAASAKLESNTRSSLETRPNNIPPDEKPALGSIQDSTSLLMQPSLSSHCNGTLASSLDSLHREPFVHNNSSIYNGVARYNDDSTDSCEDMS